MKPKFTLIGLVALSLLLGSPGLTSAEDGQCLKKRDIQTKVAAGELLQLADAAALAGLDGKIISSGAQLCQQGGIWQWIVTVMDEQGETRLVSLPAQ